VIGDATHGDLGTPTAYPCRKGQIEHLRRNFGILSEHLVEVTHAEEQYGIGHLALSRLPLLEHRREVVRTRDDEPLPSLTLRRL